MEHDINEATEVAARALYAAARLDSSTPWEEVPVRAQYLWREQALPAVVALANAWGVDLHA